MTGELKDKIHDGTDLICMRLDGFLKRLRDKVLPAKHKLKKTDRFQMITRYPNYSEETEEQKQISQRNIDLTPIFRKGYDQELLAKFKSFFAFLARIFKKSEK